MINLEGRCCMNRGCGCAHCCEGSLVVLQTYHVAALIKSAGVGW